MRLGGVDYLTDDRVVPTRTDHGDAGRPVDEGQDVIDAEVEEITGKFRNVVESRLIPRHPSNRIKRGVRCRLPARSHGPGRSRAVGDCGRRIVLAPYDVDLYQHGDWTRKVASLMAYKRAYNLTAGRVGTTNESHRPHISLSHVAVSRRRPFRRLIPTNIFESADGPVGFAIAALRVWCHERLSGRAREFSVKYCDRRSVFLVIWRSVPFRFALVR